MIVVVLLGIWCAVPVPFFSKLLPFELGHMPGPDHGLDKTLQGMFQKWKSCRPEWIFRQIKELERDVAALR